MLNLLLKVSKNDKKIIKQLVCIYTVQQSSISHFPHFHYVTIFSFLGLNAKY